MQVEVEEHCTVMLVQNIFHKMITLSTAVTTLCLATVFLFFAFFSLLLSVPLPHPHSSHSDVLHL